jgi:hypothetical protein
MIGFNWLAAIGYVNGVTPQTISDRFPTNVTPSGYAFSIWSLIYLGLCAFSIYQVLPSAAKRFSSARTPYILSCFLNCTWIFFWHREQVVFCVVIIAFLWLTLLWTYRLLAPQTLPADVWLIKAPFGIYLGWVTAATLVNLAVAVRAIDPDIHTATAVVFGVVLLLIAAIVGVTARIRLGNFFVPLAVSWALTGIAVKQSGQTAIVVASAVGVVACLIAALSFVVNLKGTSHE